ncbi:MAG: MarR family transcriptional regulator [Elainellaceae cyanobacterium]
MTTQTMTPDQCAVDVLTVIPLVTRWLRAEMRHQGQPHLSLSQLRVLHFLHRRPQSSLSELADYLDVTRPTMSVMVDRLVQRGWVHRQDDVQERRRIALTLTEAGTAQLEQVYGATLTQISQRLQSLSAEQCQQVMAGLSVLSSVFAEA